MTEVEITDAGGEKLSMLDFGGFKMSYYGQKAEKIRDVYENLPNFEFREDDIFLTSYPKSGCTWTFEIVSMLLAGNVSGLSYEKGVTMLDAKTVEDINMIPSPRIVNAHLPFEKLPSDLIKKKIKIIYVIRNYKDVTVSMYNFQRALKHYNYNGRWGDWLQLHLEGKLTFATYFSYVQQWEHVIQTSDLPIHVVYYEDLKSDTLNEIKRIGNFLGLQRDDKVLEDIALHCQFDVMKTKYSNEEMDSLKFKKGTGFFRKGLVGDWKSWYTVAQNDMVNEMIRTNMVNYKTSIHFGGKYEM